MKLKQLIFFLIIMTGANNVQSQDFSSHLWNDRLVIIKTNSITDNELYKNQLKAFKENKAGLKDRKILIYQINGNKLKHGIENNSDWIKLDPKAKADKLFKNAEAHFEVILIGLDGGIKLRQSSLLKCKDLFSIIDVMPMRVQELKKN